jgi:hypothetical protein
MVREKQEKESRTPPRLPARFRGVCEAQLWKFTAPESHYNVNEPPESHLVAAQSIDEALKYIQRREPDFSISKAECIGLIAMLSGSPLD